MRIAGGAQERAVVATVAVNDAPVLPLTVTELGDTEQVAPVGAPLQLKLTEPLKPLTGESFRL